MAFLHQRRALSGSTYGQFSPVDSLYRIPRPERPGFPAWRHSGRVQTRFALDGEARFPVGSAARVPARRMLRAAFVSALITDPQPEHSYTAWLLWWLFSLSPQHEHVVLVCCGSTCRSSRLRHGCISQERPELTPPISRIDRLSPAYCRTFEPGSPSVPSAPTVLAFVRRPGSRQRHRVGHAGAWHGVDGGLSDRERQVCKACRTQEFGTL